MHFRSETLTASTFPAAPSLVRESISYHQIKKERAFSKGLKREQVQPDYEKGGPELCLQRREHQDGALKGVYKTDPMLARKLPAGERVTTLFVLLVPHSSLGIHRHSQPM